MFPVGDLPSDVSVALREALGYLNFSSGKHDPKFFANLNRLSLFAQPAGPSPPPPAAGKKSRSAKTPRPATSPAVTSPATPLAAVTDVAPCQRLGELLTAGLAQCDALGAATNDYHQAEAVVRMVFDRVLPDYLRYHADLLFHQTAGKMFNAYFVGRAAEAVLQQPTPWDDPARTSAGAVKTLNDYLGYRPVAILNTKQKIEPYDHERLRPVPLYVAGAGVAAGKYEAVVRGALDILRAADKLLLARAWFDLTKLDELAYDPRAYDFDHPVHKRPNHHFGQWDLHTIDNRGYYRRFVVQQVTLDTLYGRMERQPDLPPEELLFEAAAVLAGTILMGSGTSGDGPEAHDSSVTLANLLPHIARYRDEFYDTLLQRATGAHATRLRAEARLSKQPFGGARQDLNTQLARLRASQLEHVHLAQLFAQMGFPAAAGRQLQVVPVASARMQCDIYCTLATLHMTLDAAAQPGISAPALEQALAQTEQVRDTLGRAIECGAIVDPWNVLGFDCHYSLFPALENSVYDHRIDQLINVASRMFETYLRLVSEAAAEGHLALRERLLARLDAFATWWDRFATDQVSNVESIRGREVHESATHVGAALAAWQQEGAAAGNIAFWRQQVADFNSPKTFARVTTVLLDKQDFVAAMALLIQWVAQCETVPLDDGEASFHALAQRWQGSLLASDRPDRQTLALKFLDFLEANADAVWSVPRLELEGATHGGQRRAPEKNDDDLDGDDDESGGDLFSAAYEGMVFRDSAADGIEGEMIESGGGQTTDFELERESRRISDRLAFLSTLAELWKRLAFRIGLAADCSAAHHEGLARWHERASENHQQLLDLLASIHHYRVAPPSGSHDSMVEYDRRRSIKDALLERVIVCTVEMQDAAFYLAAQAGTGAAGDDAAQQQMAVALRAICARDVKTVRRAWRELVEELAGKPILYIPLARGGDPAKIAAVRSLQLGVQQLLAWLPRLGLFVEAVELIETVRRMEVEHPVGVGAVTEFDRLFEIGYKALVESLVESAQAWQLAGPGPSRDGALVDALQQLTEPMLVKWLSHSQTLRLSILERIDNENQWRQLQHFVQRYGEDLFTQHFLNMGNLRAILHQGVDNWLVRLKDQPEPEDPERLVEELDSQISRPEAARHLAVIFEAVVDNYTEYRDYNSTTTQSDRGEMLYTLLAFLRLKAQYERTNWNLRPVVMAHEVLVRRNEAAAAELWRRALADRTCDIADTLAAELARLQKKHGMRLPTVADRLAERFIRPLHTDRVLALVRPAMTEILAAGESPSFEQLELETAELTKEPTGVGLDLPDWLAELEGEVETVRRERREGQPPQDQQHPFPPRRLTYEQLQQELDRLRTRG